MLLRFFLITIIIVSSIVFIVVTIRNLLVLLLIYIYASIYIYMYIMCKHVSIKRLRGAGHRLPPHAVLHGEGVPASSHGGGRLFLEDQMSPNSCGMHHILP